MTEPPDPAPLDPATPVAGPVPSMATTSDPSEASADVQAPAAPPNPTTSATGTPSNGSHRLEPWARLVAPLGLLLAVLIASGIYLRLRDFGYPTQLQFDEHHFVETARGYLKHQSDWNDHPPLGKLLIAAGMRSIGDTSVGFRVPALIAGLLSIGLGALAAQRLFASRWAGAIAAALLAADGFFIAYSRAALLDGFLAMASLAALLLVTFDLSLLWGCAAGLVLGFAASVKFSGIGVLLPLLFAVAIAKKTLPAKTIAVVALALVGAGVYFSSYALGLAMTEKPSGIIEVILDTQRLLKHHAELTDMKNGATSGWITWVLPTRPLLLGIWEKHGAIRALSTLGNLATWWGSVLLTLLSLGVVLRLGWSSVLRGPRPEARDTVEDFVVGHGKQVLALLLLAIGFLAPWILTHRDSYIYHYLPAYAPLVLLLAGFLAWYQVRHPMRVLGFMVVTVLLAAFYAPLWGYVPITRDAMHLRLFISSWR